MELEKIIYIGDSFVNEETGEKWTKSQMQSKLKENAHRLFRDEYIEWVSHLGLDNELDLKKMPKRKDNKVYVKERHKYNSMYEVDLQKIMASDKLGINEVAFIGRLTPFISFPNNDIKIYNEYKTQEELGKFIGFGRTTMTNVVKKLEQEEIIKVVRGAKVKPVFYFNPFLYCSGVKININTYMMFVDSKYNPNLSRDMEMYKDNRLITNKTESVESALVH